MRAEPEANLLLKKRMRNASKMCCPVELEKLRFIAMLVDLSNDFIQKGAFQANLFQILAELSSHRRSLGFLGDA